MVRAGLANQIHATCYESVRADMGHATGRPSRCAKVYQLVGTVGLFCSVCIRSYRKPTRLRVSGLALSAQVKLLVPPTPLAPTYPQRDCWRGVVGEKQPARPGGRFASFPPTSPSVLSLWADRRLAGKLGTHPDAPATGLDCVTSGRGSPHPWPTHFPMMKRAPT